MPAPLMDCLIENDPRPFNARFGGRMSKTVIVLAVVFYFLVCDYWRLIAK
jgi:hypothetical protein